MRDYHQWVQDRAEELALEYHDIEYESLPSNLQENMWAMATRDYRDMQALKLEFTLERMSKL